MARAVTTSMREKTAETAAGVEGQKSQVELGPSLNNARLIGGVGVETRWRKSFVGSASLSVLWSSKMEYLAP